MGSVKKQPNGRYRARYREDGGKGKEVVRHFKRETDARRWLAEQTAAMVTGQYVSPKAGRVTFQDYAEEWRQIQPHRKTTQERTESQLRNHAYPAFGHKFLGDVRPSHVQAWVKRLELGDPQSTKANGGRLAPATIAVVHGMVHGVFAAAVRDRRIVSNPCIGTKLPKAPKAHVDPPTVEEVRAVTGAMPPHVRALVTLVAGTGVRPGEALGLTVDRLDMLRKQVRIDRQIQAAGKGAVEFVPPKTAASYRTIPLPESVVTALAAHLAAYPVGPEGFVFTDESGKPYTRSRWGQVWTRARAEAGVRPTMRLHDLRHFYASLLIRHGESVKTVQARLGHASAAETLDTYSHLWPDSEERTRDAVDEVLGGFGDGQFAPRSAKS